MASRSADTMSPTERAELRRIVKGRFELLATQLQQRKEEIEQVIRARITSEYDVQLALAKRKANDIIAAMDKLDVRIDALLAETETMGVKPEYQHRYGTQKSWLETRLSLDRWEPNGLDARVKGEFSALAREHGYAKINLRAQELEILEELSVRALRSDEAREFLGRIPVVDNLLPLPANAQHYLAMPVTEEES